VAIAHIYAAVLQECIHDRDVAPGWTRVDMSIALWYEGVPEIDPDLLSLYVDSTVAVC